MSLSDKKRYGELSSFCNVRKYYYPEEDVQEFIKELKKGKVWVNGNGDEILSISIDDLNLLLGEELSK